MIVRIARVKVGNRQAPLQQTETPPPEGGVSAFRDAGVAGRFQRMPHTQHAAVPVRAMASPRGCTSNAAGMAGWPRH